MTHRDTSEFSLNSSITVGIHTAAFDDNLMIYPNPANSKLFVELSESKFQNADFKILNMLGETVMNGQLKEMQNVINVNTLGKGIYFLQLYNADNLVIRKIIMN